MSYIREVTRTHLKAYIFSGNNNELAILLEDTSVWCEKFHC